MSNPMRALLNHFGVLLSVVCLYPVPQRTTLLNQFRDWGAAVSLTCSQGTETADTDVQIRINIQVQANAADPTGVRIRCIDLCPLHALVGRPSRPVFVIACVFFPCRLACSAHMCRRWAERRRRLRTLLVAVGGRRPLMSRGGGRFWGADIIGLCARDRGGLNWGGRFRFVGMAPRLTFECY